MHRIAAILILFLSIGTCVAAQPDYLQPIINNITHATGIDFTETLARVQDRSVSGFYSPDDISWIVQALAARAEHSPDVRPDILTVLGQIGSPESVPILLTYLQSENKDTRISTEQSLGWIGDPRALEPLKLRQHDLQIIDTTSYENFMLIYAIGAIQIKTRLKDLSPKERLHLVRKTLLNEPNWLIRADIARQLLTIPGPDIWPTVFDAYEKFHEPEQFVARLSNIVARRYEEEPTGYFTELRKRPVPSRLFGLHAIQNNPQSSDLSTLMSMADTDPDSTVRDLAMKTLGSLMQH